MRFRAALADRVRPGNAAAKFAGSDRGTPGAKQAHPVESEVPLPVSRSRSPGGWGGSASAVSSPWWMSAFDGEEQVVASGVVPVLRGGAHDPDPSGHQLVGLPRARERGMVVRADEHDSGAGALGSVAGVGEAPAAEECVVGEELLAVVGGAGGEVDLDEQVEGELQRFDAELEREVGLDLGERLELEVDDRLPVGDRDLVERDRVPALALADLGDGVAAGGVAGCAPAVGGQRRRRRGGTRSPSRARGGRARAGRRGVARSASIRVSGRSPGRARAAARPGGRGGSASAAAAVCRRWMSGRAGRWCAARSGRGGRA